MLMLLVVLAVAVSAQAIDVPNGDFETLYKPGTMITGIVSAGGWSMGVGLATPIDSGLYEFADATTGDVADVPGWIGYDAEGWIAGGGTYGRDETRGPGYNQGAQHNQGTYAGVMGFASNGGGYGNSAGGLITSAASLGIVDGSALRLSMMAMGGAGPIVLDLLADGVALTATASSVTPDGDWNLLANTYDEATLASVIGQELTIVVGVGRGATGNQSKMDNVTLVPEPATMSLLALGGLALIRRRKA
jgi:hypothetical protein